MSEVYHLELRQFPHVARVFNLDRAELDARFLRPWVQGTMIDQDDRRWAPERTRLKVLSGPPVAPNELGLGRGWGAATKDSEDVTDAVIGDTRRGAEATPAVEALKEQVARRAQEPVGLPVVAALAGAAHPDWRASEQLGVAEQAVWELLHQGRATMLVDGQPVSRERWQEVMLRFATWAPAAGDPPVLLHSRPGSEAARETTPRTHSSSL